MKEKILTYTLYIAVLLGASMLLGSEIVLAASEVEVVPIHIDTFYVSGGSALDIILADQENGLTVANAFYRASVSVGLYDGDTIQYTHISVYFWHNYQSAYGTVAIGDDPVDDWIRVGSFTVGHHISAVLSGTRRGLYIFIDNTDPYGQTYMVYWRVFRLVSVP